ncbi:50S ribosomal protein L11 methyltransferase [Massilibacteroides vaginae]|uniref:50S ribosomal protein L11 methyltransferase n=1 Tax=Massilibacteroides vaginae TaxID=1673718 RepID=UPI000A1CAE15|nr:50S ribosomal protein L11 methyltransferase [Massilibacteroides vaginae]
MDYYCLKITFTSSLPSEIITDVLSSELGEIGFESFDAKEDAFYAYVPVTLYNQTLIAQKLIEFPLEDVTFHYDLELVKAKNWNEEWEKNYFQPIRIGDQCIIRASFHAEEPGFSHTLLIDPKMAFGTGNHDTTRLMITELLETDLAGKTVLDMGCGTAVLAILARKLGAAETTAIDIDEWAYENALENISLNNVSGIDVKLGGAEQIGAYSTFDLILANINRNILLNDMHYYANALKPGALLFMSGFYTEDIPMLENEARKNNLTLIKQKESNKWAMMLCSKNNA